MRVCRCRGREAVRVNRGVRGLDEQLRVGVADNVTLK